MEKLWPCARCKRAFPDAEMTKDRWSCKPCWRAYMRFRRYGITAEQYQALAASQGNACAICGGHNIVKKKNGRDTNGLAVDHKAGRVRGLLCGMCNRGLGYFRDDPTLLGKAARYLVGWKP